MYYVTAINNTLYSVCGHSSSIRDIHYAARCLSIGGSFLHTASEFHLLASL